MTSRIYSSSALSRKLTANMGSGRVTLDATEELRRIASYLLLLCSLLLLMMANEGPINSAVASNCSKMRAFLVSHRKEMAFVPSACVDKIEDSLDILIVRQAASSGHTYN